MSMPLPSAELARVIEAMQLSEYRRAGLPPPTHDAPGVAAWIGQLRHARAALEPGADRDAVGQRLAAKYQAAYLQFPPASRFEVVHNHLHLATIVGGLVSAMKQQHPGRDDLDRLLICTVPSTLPDARILRLGTSKQTLILFNLAMCALSYGLATFLSTYCGIHTGADGNYVVDMGQKTLQRNIAQDDAVFERLLHTVDALLFGAAPGSAAGVEFGITPPPMPRYRVYQSLLSGMLSFIAAHELGHVLAGHLDPPTLENGMRTAQHLYGSTAPERVRWAQEHEADLEGLQYSVVRHAELAREGGIRDPGRARLAGIVDGFQGAEMVLGLCNMLEISAQLATGRPVDPDFAQPDHPPIHHRRQRLLGYAARQLYPEAAPLLRRISSATDDVMALLAVAYTQAVLESALAQRPLSPMWARCWPAPAAGG